MTESLALYGTPVVHGVAYAPAVWVHRPPLPPQSAPALPAPHREDEVRRFMEAQSAVADSLFDKSLRATEQAADVLVVTASIATDRAWTRDVAERIRKGTPAVQAVMAATARFVVMFETAGGVMAERTTDLMDVRDRVIAHLQGTPEPGIPAVSEPFVLLADDLSPADTAGLDPSLCQAIVTRLGGPTSHTSIISRQLGIPCVVAARRLREIPEGEPVLVEAADGLLTTGVDPRVAHSLVEADLQRRALVEEWRGPAATSDGRAVELLANVGDAAASEAAHEGGLAQGIGLARTELAFLKSTAEPGVTDQVRAYAQVIAPWHGSKVVVRTLDAGSDKPVAYATLPGEENPALGVRGIRTSGPYPSILANQLDAIAIAAMSAPETRVWVMAPMVSTIPEAQWFSAMVHQRCETYGVDLRAGIMVEAPSVAILIDQFLEAVDFVSIGTNDLTQYTMAADRTSADLAEYADPWQPAPLSLIAQVARAGARTGKPVGVCGEAGADPLLACVLVGMGVSSLSMASGAIPGVGAMLATVTMDQCEAAARAVVGARDGGEGRYRARRALGLM